MASGINPANDLDGFRLWPGLLDRSAQEALRQEVFERLRAGPLWDTAAGQCVVEQAGGIVTDITGSPLRYNTKESLINPHFLVAGDIGYPWQQYVSG